MDPLVSIIVCSYNSGPYLRPSVLSALAQTHRKIEVLLVDDGSTDGSIDTILDLTDPRLRILRKANEGKPVALNLALAEAKGDFYAIHDADDLSHPERIEHQVASLLKNSDVAAVLCGHEIILGERRVAPRSRAKGRKECAADIAEIRMPAHDPTAMYRVSQVSGILYEPTLRIGQGYDYLLRVGERFPMLVVGECLYSYRIHSTSVTKRDPARREHFVREVLRRACERRGLNVERQFPSSPRGRSDAMNDNNLAAHFIESAIDLRRHGRRWDALKTGLHCARLHPLHLHYQKAIMYAVSPQWVVQMVRRSPSGA